MAKREVKINQQKDSCPCGSNKAIGECCGAVIAGKVVAVTAEALMRSRYTAYVTGQEAYLLASWHSSTRPATLGLADEAPVKWLGLEVRRCEQQDADHATIEFVARHKVNGRAHRLHETSRFVREQGRWYYLDGDIT